ncbi:unnamed protein product [Knipowitschia caucasica]
MRFQVEAHTNTCHTLERSLTARRTYAESFCADKRHPVCQRHREQPVGGGQSSTPLFSSTSSVLRTDGSSLRSLSI